MKTVEELAVESIAVRNVVSGLLRAAVTEFNEAIISVSSIDRLRENVLTAADMLALPQADQIDMTAAKDAELGARLGLRVVRA